MCKKKSKRILHALAHATSCDSYQAVKAAATATATTIKWQSNNRQQEIDTKIMERDVIAADQIAYVKQIICSHIQIKSDSRGTVIERKKKSLLFMRVSSVLYKSSNRMRFD